MTSFPLALQTAYQDLLSRHLHRPAQDLPGSIINIHKNDRSYWVSRQRVGQAVIESRIGVDNAETQARVERLKQQNEDYSSWQNGVSALVAQLRAARMHVPTPGTGKLINALSRAGLFRTGGILAGSHAFGLYALELGYPLESSLAMTEDVDLAAGRNVHVIADVATTLTTALDSIGLQPILGPLDPGPARWKTPDNIILDVLTNKQRGQEAIVRHEGLGVWAQALKFLEFCMEGAIDAVVLYREGVLVRIPAPERFAIHKLIVAARRTGSHRSKSAKDIAQAEALTKILADSRPYELKEAYRDARARGPAWRKAIDESLARSKTLESCLGI